MTENDDLSIRAAALADKVDANSLEIRQLTRRVDLAGRRSVRLVYAMVALVLLLVLCGGLIYQQRQTSDRLETVVQRALCPVYALVVGSYDPSTRPAGPAREKYDQTFQVMRDSYAELQCTSPLVPPRSAP